MRRIRDISDPQSYWIGADDGQRDAGLGRQPTRPTDPRDAELLDAYSLAVIGVVETIGPAVVAVARQCGQESGGVGSGVLISPEGQR